tara:strand:+ start:556 stop:702 length:147 start_codon:yes stop_codon:yes gene_type:complete
MSQQSDQARAFVHPYGPELDVKIKEPAKAAEKEEDDFPQSLEEALLGE